MAVIERTFSNEESVEKGFVTVEKTLSPGAGSIHSQHIVGHETDPDTALHRGLKARHVTMIAIGGAIGTGLIIGTGAALAQAGPGSIFIAYTIIGFLVFLVMAALGEMAAWLPMSSGFTGYASRFCHPSLGFALGYTYWFKYIIVTPNQLTAAALVIQYWVPRDRVNPGVFIAVFLVTIIFINWFGIKFFGEFEFWLSSLKVLTIVGVIILSLVLALGGGPNHDRTGFRYWKHPGAFAEYKAHGATGRFLAFWSTMVTATFAYLGTELVGVTVGEAANPRRTIPKAIRLTFYRILIFYCLSVLLVGMLVPYNSPALLFATGKSKKNPGVFGKKPTAGAAASPFVLAVKLAGIHGLDHVLNGAICMFVFSASNSDLYIATRTLYGLASNGNAPKIFKKTDKSGVPIFSLAIAALISLLAFMNVSNDSKVIFGYFVNLTTIFGLLTWISILVTHIHFVRARRAQGIPDSAMPYVAPLGIWGSYGALALSIVVSITKNFGVFIGPFDYKTFITGYLGIPLYLMLLFGHMWWTKAKGYTPATVDLFTGKDLIDREENEYLAALAAKEAARGGQSKVHKFYHKFVSWLF